MHLVNDALNRGLSAWNRFLKLFHVGPGRSGTSRPESLIFVISLALVFVSPMIAIRSVGEESITAANCDRRNSVFPFPGARCIFATVKPTSMKVTDKPNPSRGVIVTSNSDKR